MTSPLLTETLDAISSDPHEPCKSSFALAEQLLAEYGEENLAERLDADIPRDCQCEVVAALFDIIGWMARDEDESAAFGRMCDQWLRDGDDLRRIKIALSQEAYPFVEREEMVRVLGQLASRWPEVAETCQALIASRRRDYP